MGAINSLCMRLTKKRILIIAGHYGSGKTEFAVSLAMLLSKNARTYPRISLVDLDIVNPYFRSRERSALLQEAGIAVYGNFYEGELTAELPALSASIRAPFEDKDCLVIVDVGGNDSGAKVLNQFKKYLEANDSVLLVVVNANRPETMSVEGAIRHVFAIEETLEMQAEGIVNNAHLLRETTAATIACGHVLCLDLCQRMHKELWCDCYPTAIVKEEDLMSIGELRMPIGMYMRPDWLDR